jgi:hypothetical protein
MIIQTGTGDVWLPVPVVGTTYIIYNDNAASITIDAVSAGSGSERLMIAGSAVTTYSLATKKTLTLHCFKALQWNATLSL